MVRSSLSDIKNRALAFSQRWADAADEDAQAKPFWLDFLEIFGLSDKRLAQFEHHVRRLGQRRGYIDLFWPGKLLVEHNSLGKNPGPVNYNLFDFNQRADAEYQLSALRDNGNLSQGAWGDFTLGSVNDMLSSGSPGEGLKPGGSYGLQPPANWLDPIGAFYDSQSAAYDNAASIASKTSRAMNANGQAFTTSQLAALDTNGDGQISTSEASGLRLWADLNENGLLDTNELQGVASAIKSADYGFYTRGNGRVASNDNSWRKRA